MRYRQCKCKTELVNEWAAVQTKNRKSIKPTNNIHIRWMGAAGSTHKEQKKLLEKSSPLRFEWVDCEWADLWWHDEQKEANEWVWDAHTHEKKNPVQLEWK